jgi:hypothetical protein
MQQLPQNLMFILIILISLTSCFDSGSNRSSSSNPVTPGLNAPANGVHILSACSCKNGVLVDGTEGCANSTCLLESGTFTELTVSIGKDIFNPIFKANGKTFNAQSLLKSVCELSKGYKCQIRVEESYVHPSSDKNVYELKQSNPPPYPVMTTSSSAKIVSDATDRGIIRLNSTIISKAMNLISFEILFKDETFGGDTKHEVVHTSEEKPQINVYKGDGKIDSGQKSDLNAYNCIFAQRYQPQNSNPIPAFSMETFHYENNLMPLYYYELSGNSWPFLCHQNISGAPLISWNVAYWRPSLNLYERSASPLFPRLNSYFTGISFWGGQGSDLNDFSESYEARYESEGALYFDIERRIMDQFKKKESNGEWIQYPIFSRFSYLKVPDRTPVTIGGSERIALPKSYGGYYMQPQPESSTIGPRYTYKCPSKDMLLASDDGRIGSIKKVLSSANGTLEYHTKPFFAACADVSRLNPIGNETFNSPMRRIIYLTYDDLVKIFKANNPNMAIEQIDQILFGEAESVTYEFTLKQHFKLKTGLEILSPNSTDIDKLKFRLVTPAVVSEEDGNCSPSQAIENENSTWGYVFGCYPEAL